MSKALIPEWHPCEAVVLAWPHENTDWLPWLSQARQTLLAMINAINSRNAGVILLCRDLDIEQLKRQLANSAKVLLLTANYNDTWARDYTFLTCGPLAHPSPVEYEFNGWGNKFLADKDNKINRLALSSLCKKPLKTVPLVVEGGALEIDDRGHLLSTASCLFNPERNGEFSAAQYQASFEQALGAAQLTIFTQGHLSGDDTDGHIDTLVRYTPNKGLVIQTADNRPSDCHWGALQALADECAAKLPDHKQFLLPLPEIYNEDGERLPASYANYLLCNQALLAPIYNQPEDVQAIQVLSSAFPDYTVIPIDCSAIIQQFGSLHCLTMQIPVNTLKTDVVRQFEQGVTHYVE